MFEKRFFVNVIKSALISVCCALVGILLFALIVKLAALPSATIKAVNQFIKGISIFCGCFFSIEKGGGLVKGAVSGMLFIALVYIAFLIISVYPSSLKAFWLDEVFGLLVGGVSGAITVNVRERR